VPAQPFWHRDCLTWCPRGDRILLDDGRLELEVGGFDARHISTRVIRGGEMRGRTGVHVQGKELPFPSLSTKHRRKLKIAVDNGADWIGVSFVQGPKNILAVRRALTKLGAPKTVVVAKIESLSGLANLDSIIDVADMIMIARGDLSQAVGNPKALAKAQAFIAERCRAKHKPFIVATGLMSGMLRGDQPTKANVKDVKHSAAQGPTWLMLNETAISPEPVRTVWHLDRLL
jgi:pyruvate kinase